MEGRKNISIGLLVMGFFMIYGFLLIYLRDFSPEKADWVAHSTNGKHFESRLAHVHGNLFAFLNIVIGFLLLQFGARLKHTLLVSRLAIVGLLMPIGILTEVYFSAPPVLVLVGALSIITSVILLGLDFYKLKEN